MSEEQKNDQKNASEDSKDAEGQSAYKYVCKNCGRYWYGSSCWDSKCPDCGRWGTRV